MDAKIVTKISPILPYEREQIWIIFGFNRFYFRCRKLGLICSSRP
jgi:hypothetical protein